MEGLPAPPVADRLDEDDLRVPGIGIDWDDLSVILWTEECEDDEALVRLSPELARKAAGLLEKLADELEVYTKEIRP